MDHTNHDRIAARVSALIPIGRSDDQKGSFASCSWDPGDLRPSGIEHPFTAAIRIWKLSDDKSKMYDGHARIVPLCPPENRWQQPLAMTWLSKHGQVAAGLFDGTVALVSPNASDAVRFFPAPGSTDEAATEEGATSAKRREPITALAAQTVFPQHTGQEAAVGAAAGVASVRSMGEAGRR